MTPLEFTVYGVAQPQGSARAFVPKGWQRAVITSDNPQVKGWRQSIAQEASRALAAAGGQQFSGPVRLMARFSLPRPKSAGAKPKPHVTRPDLDKLTRALGDALTGVVYRDDGQVVQLKVEKQYAAPGEAPHAVIVVAPL